MYIYVINIVSLQQKISSCESSDEFLFIPLIYRLFGIYNKEDRMESKVIKNKSPFNKINPRNVHILIITPSSVFL